MVTYRWTRGRGGWTISGGGWPIPYLNMILLAEQTNRWLWANSGILSTMDIVFFSCRKVLTVLLFIARAFISGGFQAAYVYTPEVLKMGAARAPKGRSQAWAVRVGSAPHIVPLSNCYLLRCSAVEVLDGAAFNPARKYPPCSDATIQPHINLP